VAVNTS